MAKFHCVIDASALIKKYRDEAGSETIKILFNREDCALHVLNVAIPEVVGTFFSWQLETGLKPKQTGKLKGLFIQDIEEYNVVIHNINDRNIIGTDKIWEASLLVPKPTYTNGEGKTKFKQRVGPVDVLVLSVCQELKKSYGRVYLFSSDEHMLNVAEKLGINIYDPEAVSRLPF